MIDTDATTASAAWCERASYINGNETDGTRASEWERDRQGQGRGNEREELYAANAARIGDRAGVRLDEINERQWTPTVAS